MAPFRYFGADFALATMEHVTNILGTGWLVTEAGSLRVASEVICLFKSSKKNAHVLKLGAALILCGLFFNTWFIENAFWPLVRFDSLVKLITLVGFQVALAVAGARTIFVAFHSPQLDIRGFLEMDRLWIVVLIVLGIACLWICSVEARAVRQLFFGLYQPTVFGVNLLLTSLAALLLYVVQDLHSWQMRSLNAALSLLSVVFLGGLLELPAALNIIDYRTLFIPQGIGFMGPHNRQLEADGHFHRPPFEEFSATLAGDAAIYLGADTGLRYSGDYRYDARGFRNSRDIDRASFVLVGDSFIEGYKVTQDAMVSERLGTLMNAETTALAQSDFGPYQELAALTRYIGELRPRTVVWFFYEGNDLPRLETFDDFSTKAPGRAADYTSFTQRSFVRNLSEVATAWSNVILNLDSDPDLARRRSGHFRGTEPGVETTMFFEVLNRAIGRDYEKHLPKLLDVLQRVKALCDEHRAELLVAYIPIKFKVYQPLLEFPEDSAIADWSYPDIATPLFQWLEQEDLMFLDLTEPLRRAAESGTLVYYLDDEHWTPQGHELVSQHVARTLRKAGLARDEAKFE